MSTSSEWIARGDKHIAKTYGRYPLVPVRGEGCRLWDADGKAYLDFLAGVAVNSLGHCHPKVVAALQRQAATLIHCSNYYHIPQQIELAEILCANSFGDRVFFCNSGAEANEAAIKLARKFSKEKHGDNRFEVITALGSFHGRTIGGISATGQEKVRLGFEPVFPASAMSRSATSTPCAAPSAPAPAPFCLNRSRARVASTCRRPATWLKCASFAMPTSCC